MTWFKKTSKPIVASGLTLTLAGEQLSQLPQFQHIIPTIRRLVSASNVYFTELYQPIVWQLLAFCQHMPHAKTGRYAHTGGLVAFIIERLIAGLTLRQGYLLPKGGTAETIAKDEPLWTYMVFTTVLFYYSWPVVTDRIVTLHEADNTKLGVWNPLSGSLYEPDTYYYTHIKDNSSVIPPATIIATLVGRWLPGRALRWLSTHKYYYRCWWDVLLDRATPDNVLLDIIHNIEQTITENVQADTQQSSAAPALTSDTLVAAFIQWMKGNLHQPYLAVNTDDNYCHRVKAGLLVVLAHVLEHFFTSHADYRQALAIPSMIDKSVVKQFVQHIQSAKQLVVNDHQHVLHHYAINQQGKTIYIQGIVIPIDIIYHSVSVYPAINPAAHPDRGDD